MNTSDPQRPCGCLAGSLPDRPLCEQYAEHCTYSAISASLTQASSWSGGTKPGSPFRTAMACLRPASGRRPPARTGSRGTTCCCSSAASRTTARRRPRAHSSALDSAGRSSTSAIERAGCRPSPTAACCPALTPPRCLRSRCRTTRRSRASASDTKRSSRACPSPTGSLSGGDVTGRPRLGGLHLSAEPAQGWALGINRLMQYGGAGRRRARSEISRGLLQPLGLRQHQRQPHSDEQFGNQLASITSQLLFPGKVPFSVYFEYAGEDTSPAETICWAIQRCPPASTSLACGAAST